MMSMSVVRTHFCTVVARVNPRSFTPRKTGLNCTMPAVVSSSEGSSGMSDEDGWRVQPLLSKYVRKLSRISAEFTSRSSCVRGQNRMPSGHSGVVVWHARWIVRIAAGALEQRAVLGDELPLRALLVVVDEEPLARRRHRYRKQHARNAE